MSGESGTTHARVRSTALPVRGFGKPGYLLGRWKIKPHTQNNKCSTRSGPRSAGKEQGPWGPTAADRRWQEAARTGQASQVGREPALQEGVKGLAPLYLLSHLLPVDTVHPWCSGNLLSTIVQIPILQKNIFLFLTEINKFNPQPQHVQQPVSSALLRGGWR